MTQPRTLGDWINAEWRLGRAKRAARVPGKRQLYTGNQRNAVLGEPAPAPDAFECSCCGVTSWRPDGGTRCVSCEVSG